MPVDPSLLKFYECVVWPEGDTHGGGIDWSDEITSGIDENVFDDVSDAERQAGDTEYRKIYIANKNPSATWSNVKCWISEFTPAPNDEISILRGGTKSTTSEPVQLTGLLNFQNGSTVVIGNGTDFITELAKGEKIFNSTDDVEGDAVKIQSIIGVTLLYLASNYLGTTNATAAGKVAGIDQCTFVQPSSKVHGDVLDCGTLGPDEFAAIWIKRVVTAAGAGYPSDYFKLAFENA